MDIGTFIVIIIGIFALILAYRALQIQMKDNRRKKHKDKMEDARRKRIERKEIRDKNKQIIRDFVLSLTSTNSYCFNKDKTKVYVKVLYDKKLIIVVKFNKKIIDRWFGNDLLSGAKLIKRHLLVSQYYIWKVCNEENEKDDMCILKKIKNLDKYKICEDDKDKHIGLNDFVRNTVLLNDDKIFIIPNGLLSLPDADNNNNLPLKKIISDEFYKDMGIRRPPGKSKAYIL